MVKQRLTKELIFKKFDELTKKGNKLTRKNLDSIDSNLYVNAEKLFNGWMEAKKAYYDYLAEKSNPEKNLEKIVIKKVEEVENAIGIKVSVEDKLNTEFIKRIEENDAFLTEIILNTFNTWENFYTKYDQLATPEEPTYTEEEISLEIIKAINSNDLIEENDFAKKYTDIYNAVVRQYGSLKELLIHLLNQVSSQKR